MTGLSPRVRGNRRRHRHAPRPVGSIPARAGEPVPSVAAEGVPQVYPRACGGTIGTRPEDDLDHGLSPRVRGNRAPDLSIHRLRGSIPARAGEPPGEPPRRPSQRVYPRACGGTLKLAAVVGLAWGLSPRVRGNQGRGDTDRPDAGSIPARAGEP